jgi:CBS domain-containing protein
VTVVDLVKGPGMRAGDVAEPFPTVGMRTDALVAARTMGDRRLPGLIVCDDAGRPHTILPGSQVVRFMIPAYVQDDPTLARVYGESASEKLMHKLAGRTVQDLLPERQDRDELPIVGEDATILEVAALMARMRSPLVAVVEGERVVGAVTVSRLFEVLFPEQSDAS